MISTHAAQWRTQRPLVPGLGGRVDQQSRLGLAEQRWATSRAHPQMRPSPGVACFPRDRGEIRLQWGSLDPERPDRDRSMWRGGPSRLCLPASLASFPRSILATRAHVQEFANGFCSSSLRRGSFINEFCILGGRTHRRLTPSFVSDRFKHSFCSLQQKTLVSTLHY